MSGFSRRAMRAAAKINIREGQEALIGWGGVKPWNRAAVIEMLEATAPLLPLEDRLSTEDCAELRAAFTHAVSVLREWSAIRDAAQEAADETPEEGLPS